MEQLNADVLYQEWKGWGKSQFGILQPGIEYYYDSIFRSLIQVEDNILEIGFGNGQLLKYLSDRKCNVIGIETNLALVSTAIELGFSAFNGSVHEIRELKEKKFDLIILLDVIEHMEKDAICDLFRWANSHLTTKGGMVLQFPEGSSPFSLPIQNGDFTHVSSITKSKIEWLANANNMKLMRYFSTSISSNKLCSLGRLGRFFLMIINSYRKIIMVGLKILFFPLQPSLNFSSSSIAILKKR